MARTRRAGLKSITGTRNIPLSNIDGQEHLVNYIRIFYWDRSGSTYKTYTTPLGSNQTEYCIAEDPGACDFLGLHEVQQRYYGAVTYGEIALWQIDAADWTTVNTACHIKVERTHAILIKKSPEIDELRGLSRVVAAVTPSDQAPLLPRLPDDAFSRLQHTYECAAKLSDRVLELQQKQAANQLIPSMSVAFQNLNRNNRILSQKNHVQIQKVGVTVDRSANTSFPQLLSLPCPNSEWNQLLLGLPCYPCYPAGCTLFRPHALFLVPQNQYIRPISEDRRDRFTVFAGGTFSAPLYGPITELIRGEPSHRQAPKWPAKFRIADVLRGMDLMRRVDRCSWAARFAVVFQHPAPQNFPAMFQQARDTRRLAIQLYGENGLHKFSRAGHRWEKLETYVRRRSEIPHWW